MCSPNSSGFVQPDSDMLVVGLDGCRSGWAAVSLNEGRFADAALLARASEALEMWPDLAVLAIDIPIGLPGRDVSYPRAADLEVRKRLLRRRSSVFLTPPREVLVEETYAAALARSVQNLQVGLSRQAYALRSKILEIDELARSEPRVREVHPEISFMEMAGDTVQAWYPKRTWNGLAQRRACLERAGIKLPTSWSAAAWRERTTSWTRPQRPGPPGGSAPAQPERSPIPLRKAGTSGRSPSGTERPALGNRREPGGSEIPVEGEGLADASVTHQLEADPVHRVTSRSLGPGTDRALDSDPSPRNGTCPRRPALAAAWPDHHPLQPPDRWPHE